MRDTGKCEDPTQLCKKCNPHRTLQVHCTYVCVIQMIHVSVKTGKEFWLLTEGDQEHLGTV